MAEIEKVRKERDLLAELFDGVCELKRDLANRNLGSRGIAGKMSVFRTRFDKGSVIVPCADIRALGLEGGDSVCVLVCKIKERLAGV